MTTTESAPAATPSKPIDPALRRRLRRREITDRVVISLLVIAAVLFSLYPVAATYNNNYKAWKFAQETNHQVQDVPKDTSAAQLAAAHEYNKNLRPGVLNDPIFQSPASLAGYKEYEKQLNSTAAMGTLRIPKIKSTMPILHGTSDATLAKGAGHMFGTTLPVGGPNTHAGIAAHRGLPTMTAFDRLPEMKEGDQFFIDVLGQTLAYEVRSTKTVLPNDLDEIQRADGKDLVTLVTCTPYGINSHRLLVVGERIPWSEADQENKNWKGGFDWTIQDWMWQRVIIAGIALLILMLLAVRWAYKDIKAAKKRKVIAAAEKDGSS